MIRSFKEEDIEEIYKLGNLLSHNFAKTNNLEDILNDKFTKILVYEDEGIIKGFLMFTNVLESVDINDIIVSEKYRRQRIASCLMDYMISDLDLMVKVITLEVRKSNIKAINLYKKFGFEVVNVREKYYDDLEDAYLMRREC